MANDLHIDADELLKALEVPSITIGGETYTGKPIGFLDSLKLDKMMKVIQNDPSDLDAQVDYIKAVCDATSLPTDKVLTLPVDIVLTLMQRFLASRRTKPK